MKKIDIHCHTTNRLVNGTVDGNASIRNIRLYMNRYDVERTVLLASYFPHKGTGISNFRLLRWIERHDKGMKRFILFASLDIDRYPLAGYNEIEELANEGVLGGIKIYTCYQDVFLCSDAMRDIMVLAAKHGLPVMFHSGLSYACRRKYGINSPARMYTAEHFRTFAADNPEVNIILSHMSKPHFHEIVDVCESCPNVYTDMSGIIDSKYDEDEIPVCVEEIRTFLRKVGPEKMLFGTDFPVQTHEHSVRFVEEATEGMGDDVRAKIYFSNAERLLRL